jgi:hypothetical protein
MGLIEVAKGTLFIDLDGTALHSDTEEPLPYAVEKINKAYDEGYMVILTTFRGANWEISSSYSIPNTMRTLKIIGLKHHLIVWDSPSPRIIINDEEVVAYQHPCNGSWENVEL